MHLLHAPLAGGVVQISEAPLAERIQRIGGQDGVMVARPLGGEVEAFHECICRSDFMLRRLMKSVERWGATSSWSGLGT